jgi:uncharacterized membrane protein
VERVDRPDGEVARRSAPSSPRSRGWPTLFDERLPYSGIGIGAESRLGEEFAPRLVLILSMLFYACFFGKIAVDRFDAFQQPGFDLGIFDQGLWLLSRFKAPFVSIMGLDLFGDHASYILLLLVPLYWVWPAPQLLLILQTLALCLGAIPVFLLARRAIRNPWVALLPALAFLVSPALGWLNLENFHPDSFEVPLVLFALYLMTVRRWRPYMLMVVLLLLVKEDAALLVVPLGIYVALRHDRRMGIITAELGAIWFIATVFFIGPLLSSASPGSLDAFRVPFGGWRGLISDALRRPWEVGAYMLTAPKIQYLIQLLVPVFFLPLLTAETLIVLPSLLFNLLSTFFYQTNIRYHYTSLIIPVFAWAAIAYIQRVKDYGARRALALAMLLAALFASYLWGPADWSHNAVYRYDPGQPQARATAEAVALIPKDAVVAARPRMTTHLTHRAQVYEFPTPFYATYYGDDSMRGKWLPIADDVEYVLDTPDRLTGPAAQVFDQLQQQEGFRQIFSKDGVVLLQKMASGPTGSATGSAGEPSTGSTPGST